MPIIAVLCHILKGEKLLLQKKPRGLFGAGKWNGVGGKLEQNEAPEEGGTLIFYFGDRKEAAWIVYAFSAKAFQGNLRPSEEGVLRWFAFEEIPYDEMWQDDRHWLPLFLKGNKYEGNFYFDKEGKELLDFNLQVR